MLLDRLRRELDGKLPEEALIASYGASVKSKINRENHYKLTHFSDNKADRERTPVYKRIPPYGPVNSSLMIANTYPMPEDLRCGVPFSDSYGMIILAYLGVLGVNREDIFMTTVFKDLSYVGKDVGALNELSIEQTAHSLMAEITIVKPKAVLLMGEQSIRAFRELMGKNDHNSMDDLRANPESFKVDQEGTMVTFFYSFDPAHFITASSGMYAMLKDAIWADLSTATAFAGLTTQ